jgi:hypothetical protein
MRTPLNRGLSEDEKALAEWLLRHASPPALSYIPQLELARVVGKSDCGCPTIDIRLPKGTVPAEPRDNPVGDAFGTVNGESVGIMLIQHGGLIVCFEVYPLDDIRHPFGLPELHSLQSAVWK